MRILLAVLFTLAVVVHHHHAIYDGGKYLGQDPDPFVRMMLFWNRDVEA